MVTALGVMSFYGDYHIKPNHPVEQTWARRPINNTPSFDERIGNRIASFGKYKEYNIIWTNSASLALECVLDDRFNDPQQICYVDIEATMTYHQKPFKPSCLQLMCGNVVLVFYGPNVKHTIWHIVSALKNFVNTLIAWGYELEKAALGCVFEVADLQPKITVLSDNTLKYQPMSLANQIANYDYADYKSAVQCSKFQFDDFYDKNELTKSMACYAAFDVIALKDTLGDVYKHQDTLQNEYLRVGASICFMSDHVRPFMLKQLRRELTAVYEIAKAVRDIGPIVADNRLYCCASGRRHPGTATIAQVISMINLSTGTPM